ncbi:transcription initiation factor TFIID subunit 4 isoform X2 [Gasterosteus aculeatus]|uniref:transcription initiation factor TFIID subunit 4-like isoform X2 n=1 Tax=Gasterosteus aculeatus aculeatus TaxID=481459 RepID=UPI001A9942AC|nr:transcription initiation factor TFIID subunit 4-like isoform X2 [Gasterosteus aculeatus aculeatus]
MAGASDPLEDMLFNEVDEKAVSDLVGSLESQLGDREAPAASYSAGKLEGAPPTTGQFSGKVRDPVGPLEQPQQGQPEPEPVKVLPSSVTAASVVTAGATAPPTISPVPGPVTLTTRSAPVGFHRAAPGGGPVVEANRTASPGSLNDAVKLVNSVPAATAVSAPVTGSVISAVSTAGSTIIASMAAQPHFPQSPGVPLQRLPVPVSGVALNGVDPKGAVPSASAPPVVNHVAPLMQTKVLVPSQPVSGNSVILTGTPQPAVTGTGTAAVVLKPAVNGVGQLTMARPPGTPVMTTSIQQQRPGLVASSPRAAAPQLAVRPQQQTTIQLPPGFSMPPGMVLVRTETGQLVMVPQQVLAQAQAKTQQSQVGANISQRPPTPTAATAIRVSAPPTAPQTVRLAAPNQTRMVQSPSSTTIQTITVSPGGAAVSVKMPPAQKAQTVITAGGTPVSKPVCVPSSTTHTPAPTQTNRVTVVSQEMQENVKKCKNFLATLIKLASHNSPSPDTSKNVKALVQDLLDAKIEPEEFTSRLQAELKSSPQPYLIPFLKKSLPALRQSLLSSQQSIVTPGTSAPHPVAPGSVTTIRSRMPITPVGGNVRMTPPLTNTMAVGRTNIQSRTPVVFSQTLRPQGTLVRGPTTIIGKSPLNLAAQANQRKLSDPGGGTFRDDDDINDVASMAGVNLNEENARILATSSDFVGTKIRSCKDEAFLPTGLLHRRILDTAKKLGVTEVPLEVVNLVSHATQSRLRSLLEMVSAVAQHRTDGGKEEEQHEQTSDVRSQLRFFEQLERMEKQRKDEQEREILLKAAKSRARQEDPEQARLKQKAKEMQQQELAQMRQRDANLTALAAIGPRRKRRMDSPGGSSSGPEVTPCSGTGSSPGSSSSSSSSRQQLRQRITRVNLRDFIFCLEQDRSTSRSMTLYKALLK